jgi:hypothetical protein
MSRGDRVEFMIDRGDALSQSVQFLLKPRNRRAPGRSQRDRREAALKRNTVR